MATPPEFQAEQIVIDALWLAARIDVPLLNTPYKFKHQAEMLRKRLVEGGYVKHDIGERPIAIKPFKLNELSDTFIQNNCAHNWRYEGSDRGGSHKGEDFYKCTKCPATKYES